MHRLRAITLPLLLLTACGGAPAETDEQTAPGLASDPLNAVYRIEGEDVALVNGRAEHPAAPGAASLVRTVVVGDVAYGDLDADGDDDAVVWLSHETGGSGTFYYVAAALDEPNGYRGTTAFFIGDRIDPGALTIADGIVRADYLDRPPGTAMAEPPTLEKTAYLALGPVGLEGVGLEPVEPSPDAAVVKADQIVVTSPRRGAEIRAPLRVEGRARGSWYFEGDFPLLLEDARGRVIATSYATAQGEWMTREFVPFEGWIEFETPAAGGRGILIFRKDNPSDQRELDDELDIPIVFGPP